MSIRTCCLENIYLSPSLIIDREAVTVDVYAEKICDYIGTLEIKTGRLFDKRIEAYLSVLTSSIYRKA